MRLLLIVLAALIPVAFGQVGEEPCEETTPGGVSYFACRPTAVERLNLLADILDTKIEPENATCGYEPDPLLRRFCTLSTLNYECDSCEVGDHPPMYITDLESSGNTTWWQSKSWYNYPNDLQVNVTISFNKTFHLEDNIEITFQSGRPKTMVLEKSQDHGLSWQPLQYYAQDCQAAFGMPPLDDATDVAGVTQVVCTPRYSQLLPYSNGVVRFLLGDRMQALLADLYSQHLSFDPFYAQYESQAVQDFIRLTDLRIQLLYPATNALEWTGSPENLMKYYYAISDITTTVRCDCNLHSEACLVADSGGSYCDCKHNTAGTNCQECLPLFNDRPWQPGSYLPTFDGSANECQRCECNNHADSCFYNKTLGSGQCSSCYHNTAGVNCEMCIDSYYINSSLPLNHPAVCIPCDCELLGVANNQTSCSQYAIEEEDWPSGQCECQQLTTGRRCDSCIGGYYGLLIPAILGTCQECECNLMGTINGSRICEGNGQCPCKIGTGTRTCGECQDGFYNFPPSINEDCLNCDCDVGGSLDTVCDKVTGVCKCQNNLAGRKCDQVEVGFYFQFINANSYDAWGAQTDCTQAADFPASNFTGSGYLLCSQGQSVTFSNVTAFTGISNEWNYFPVIGYFTNSVVGGLADLSVTVLGTSPYGDSIAVPDNATDFEVPPEDGSAPCPIPTGSPTFAVTIDFEFGATSWNLDGSVEIALDRRCRYQFQLTVTSASGELQIDSLIVLPNITEFSIYQQTLDQSLRLQYDECLLNSAQNKPEPTVAPSNTCKDLAFSTSAQINNGAISCDCNEEGSENMECAPYGGQCQCKPGVFGRTCDTCMPGFYNFTSNGCTACNCNPDGSEGLVCDLESGQCPCRVGVATSDRETVGGVKGDLRCGDCLKNYFGFGDEDGCLPCDCHPTGSLLPQCDVVSGACQCRNTVGSPQCDSCLSGFYNFTATGCSTCDCNQAGSEDVTCDQVTGQCACRTNVEGVHCDACVPDHFNLVATNPDGCQPCFCFLHTTQCSSAGNHVTSVMASTFTGSLDGWTINTLEPVSALTSSGLLVSQLDSLPADTVLYLAAPQHFLGDKLSSYTGHLTVTAKVEPQSANGTVAITGNQGSKLAYSGPWMLTPDLTPFSFLLHESLWVDSETALPVSSLTFEGVLANLKSVEIQASFGADLMATFYSVSLDSTEYSDSSNDTVGSVEECSCPSSSNLQGLSCEECLGGYKRSMVNGSGFDSCLPCDCSGRSSVCDAQSGVCQNCRSGTTGDFCQSCLPNVAEPDCGQCLPDHYGFGTDLFSGACQACNCNVTGTGGVTQCDNENGACPCVLNYGGDRCDRCRDNYFNYSVGCIECDECYNVINSVVTELRSLVANLTLYVEFLQSQDNSTLLGPFHQRLQQSTTQLTLLIATVNEAASGIDDGTEDPNLASVNQTLQRLLASLEGPIDSNLETSVTLLNEVLTLIREGEDSVEAATDKIQESHDVINGGALQEFEDALTQLQACLASSEDTLNLLAKETNLLLTALEEDAILMTNSTVEAEITANSALKTAQNGHLVHDNTTSRVADLYTRSQRVGGELDQLNSQAESLGSEVTGVKALVEETLQDVSQPNSNENTDVNELIVMAVEKNAQAFALETQASTAIDDQRSLIEELARITNKTQRFLSVVGVVVSDVNQRLVRAQSSSLLATDAANLANRTFEDAQEMLNLLENFDTLTAELESTASSLLDGVSGVEAVGKGTIAEAQRLHTELAGAEKDASTALESALETVTLIEAEITNIKPINDRAEKLSENSQSKLNDVNQLKNDVDELNATKVSPQISACNVHQTVVDNLQMATGIANEKATATDELLDGTQKRLDQLILNLNLIDSLDSEQLAKLKEEIDKASVSFTAESYQLAISALKAALDDQTISLESARVEVASLKAQIKALESFRFNN